MLKMRFVVVFKGDGNFLYFRQLIEIGLLFFDIKRNFYNDRSMLKYYVFFNDIYKVRFDLIKGYYNFIEKDEIFKEYINDILKWIKFYFVNVIRRYIMFQYVFVIMEVFFDVKRQ